MPVAMYRKSRRVGAAEDIVVTATSPFPVLPVSPPALHAAGSEVPLVARDPPLPAPGKGGTRRNPARFYWHPCRESASPLAHVPRREPKVAQALAPAMSQTPAAARNRSFRRMRIALLEPDIAQNTGTILRLCACLGVEAHIVEPAGFPTTDRAFRRAGMDYLDEVAIVRHSAWQAFDD